LHTDAPNSLCCFARRYYDSDEFSANQPSLPNFSILHGTGVCDQHEAACTVPEEDGGCTCTTTGGDVTTIEGDGCSFTNDCAFRIEQGYSDLAIAGCFLLFNVYMGWSHGKIATKADEAEQTAQDYSLMVNDPDPDATDPDEWKKFFSQFGHVSYVSVAINNATLMKELANRCGETSASAREGS
jgi:hypothetical protein